MMVKNKKNLSGKKCRHSEILKFASLNRKICKKKDLKLKMGAIEKQRLTDQIVDKKGAKCSKAE